GYPPIFDRSKLKTIADFRKAFDKLCAVTPSKKEVCNRISSNQELFIEYQQKCLHQYDPTLQQAIEHAGDIIRELTKYGCEAYDLGYIGEKVGRLNRRVEDLAERKSHYVATEKDLEKMSIIGDWKKKKAKGFI
ncbi:unnamed protein product, partial [marine sediment metagenome]